MFRLTEKEIEAKIKAQELIISAMAWEKVRPNEPLTRLVHAQFMSFVEIERRQDPVDQEFIDLVREAMNAIQRPWPHNR